MFLHLSDTFEGFGGADEDGGADAVVLGSDVEHPMHSVGEIDVGEAGRAEHDLVARGGAAEGVAAGVVESTIGLDLDDSGSFFSHDQVGSEQGDGATADVGSELMEDHFEGHLQILVRRELDFVRFVSYNIVDAYALFSLPRASGVLRSRLAGVGPSLDRSAVSNSP